MSASFAVLHTGYVGQHTASTVGFIRDGEQLIVTDPGMVRDRGLILDPLRDLGVEPDDVTDVVFSHHHPDHTLNAALFPRARFHDHWAIYQGDLWIDRDADNYQLSPSVRLIRTPGHTPEDITTLVDTADGVVAFTHLWWMSTSTDDPYATDPDALLAGRARVLQIAGLIVPGHGAPFEPTKEPPR
ncbi:MBL fold metallo-hydrolase [Dactylosporangium sp. NPDC051541]|uniref:MBL fold metallo-hydrolase n=1 Tax=Dactylosporangium sp. NPDC051541 TaxID=3363977 RepID=UPI0037B05136